MSEFAAARLRKLDRYAELQDEARSSERQTLVHVLNCCPSALNWGRYNTRHDSVLRALVDDIRPRLGDSVSFSADVGDGYRFPTHIVPTDLHPDIVWWDDCRRVLVLVELTIPFETSFAAARLRKLDRYAELQDEARSRGFRTTVLTLEVGSRGVPNVNGFKSLKKLLRMSSKDCWSLLKQCIARAIEGSFTIWTERNCL